MKTKICSKCKIEKLVSEFGYCKISKDNLQYYCKDCIKTYNTERTLKLKKEQNKNVKQFKTCTKCKVKKSISNFTKRADSKDGFRSECKSCMNHHKVLRKNIYLPLNKNIFKICTKCGIKKELSEFNKDKYSRDSLRTWCKSCTLEYSRNYSIILGDKKIKHDKQYSAHYLKQIAKFSVYAGQLDWVEKVMEGTDDKLIVYCTYCGKALYPTNLQTKTRLRAIFGNQTGENRFYCSEACKEACPTYNQKKYWKGQNDNRSGTPREVDAWFRQYVLQYDNWTCQKCGATKDENLELVLHVHHINGVAQRPMLQNDIDNAVTLCKDCHKDVHKKEGCSYYNYRRPKCIT